MQESETRIINQCTYTPLPTAQAIKGEVYRPDVYRPYAKKGILTTVFDDIYTSQLVLERIDKKKHRHYGDLASAVGKAIEGDFITSANILSGIKTQEVIDFAKDALKAERSLLEEVEQDIEKAISSLAGKEVVSAETASELRREMHQIHDSIVSEVKNLVRPNVSSDIQSEYQVREFENAGRMVAKEASSLAEPLRRVEAPTAQPMTITLNMIHNELAQYAPKSAAFIVAIEQASQSQAQSRESSPSSLIEDITARRNTSGRKQKTLDGVIQNMRIEPVGYLHLERLQFTPEGYDKGELVYSLPMLPGEIVRLSHREWSRTETEFSKLVYTQLETATEEALSEKSELTQSASSQQQHSSGHNASVTASGGYGGVNITASYAYNCSNSELLSRQDSSMRAQEITKKASSRSKEEHKISFKVATTYELEEQSFREIKNESNQEVNWQFYRLMKRWKIDLYRYDVRLTYDIVIPEPGSYLLRKYIQLKAINDELAKPNPFNISANNISKDEYISGSSRLSRTSSGSHRAPEAIPNEMYWQALSQKYGVPLDPPPEKYIYLTFTKEIVYSKPLYSSGFVELALPDGYEFDEWEGYEGFYYTKGGYEQGGTLLGAIHSLNNHNYHRLETGLKHSNIFSWIYEYIWYGEPPEGASMSFNIDVKAKLTEKRFKEWQMKCYEALADAAKAQYESKQQRLKQMRDELLKELNREDALMLRKLEKEEIMKGVLRWLIGPTFRFYPHNMPDLTLNEEGKLEYYDPTTESVKKDVYEPSLRYGELVKFLHQAIEWENINYILYPYFWTDEDRWDFKQFLYHSDYIHRSFLRAGVARVVLTIRPDFEKPFLSFMEGTEIYKLLPSNHPYMSIADELETVAKSNYPYTQDANTEKEEYMFTWENIPAGGSSGSTGEGGKLKRYLRQAFYVKWAEDDGVIIVKENNRIIISIDKDISGVNVQGSVEIELNETETADRATLKIGNKTYNLDVKMEDNNHKIYREQNLVDTWYEYTPTGALHVERFTPPA